MPKTNLLRRPLAETPSRSHEPRARATPWTTNRRLGETTMKVALVHDYIKGEGGAEQVLLTLHEMFPEAPIYTIFSNVGHGKGTNFEKKYAGAKIITSWFDRLPYREKLMSPLRFLLPVIWGSFSVKGRLVLGWDFSDYDLVISSASWAVTKGFTGEYHKYHKQGTGEREPVEICYCHTPPRILYGYETSRNWKKHWYIRIYALITNHFLRQYDFRQAQKVTQFVANSKVVQDRIWKFYRRESVVINPPVDVDRFKVQSAKFKVTVDSLKLKNDNYIDSNLRRNDKEDNGNDRVEYYLAGGRLEMPKNFDKIILACNHLKVQLKIYGSGPQMEYLRSIAGPTVELLGGVSDEEKIKLYQNCRAYITAAVDEDFGITPVEAMAAGKPVIAFKGGGYLETVVDNKTGVFFDQATVDGLVKVLQDFRADKFNEEDCRKRAQLFSKEAFKEKMLNIVGKTVG